MRQQFILALSLYSSISITSVQAQDDTAAAARGAACATIADSLQRLTCFDTAFPKGGTTSAPQTNAPQDAMKTAAPDNGANFGGWHVETTKSAIDDSPKVVAYLAPSDQSGFSVTPKIMTIRCVENVTSVIISTDAFSFGADTGRVTVRTDDTPAQVSTWDMADDGRSVGLWNGATAIPFLRSLHDAKKLAIRVQLNKQSDLVFTDLTGVGPVVDTVAAACGWQVQK